MEDYSRPDPDELLARVKAEEEQKERGKLKIFLGYAPGVGKTYTMLEAARQRKKDTDIVVAYVETHGRVETEALLEGLEIIPRRQVEYRGIKLPEMDIDAVLARRPQLALVDELAHENAPGSRHVKRYQDIEELLEAKIDVYTTLNIQHIESGRNVVAQIIGVWVRETVPDSFVDSAREIELVDLAPDELLKRLKEGKVYIPEQIASATESFFRRGNLMALRELTMRMAAKHVDEQTLAYMKAHSIRGPWQSGERLLLFVGPGSSGSRLVRSARRLAYELGAEWSAVYVKTPDSTRLTPDQQDRIMDSLRLAQRLGAKTVTIQGDSVATMATEYAKANNITKIVVAKPQRRRLWRLPDKSAVNQIIRQSENIDVYLVSGGAESVKREKRPNKAVPGNWRGYLPGLGLVALATLLGELAPEFFASANMIMVYLLCVVATAFFWGFGPSILASILSVLLFDLLFIPPILTFSVYDSKYIFTFIVLLLVGLIISYLMRRIRQQTEAATRREHQTAALYALGRDLAISNDLETYIHAIIKRAKETFGHDTMIFLPDPQNKESLKPYASIPNVIIDENELAAAVWSFQHQRIVGHGTDTLPNAKARYLPLVTARGTTGVIAISAIDTSGELTTEQERLLEAYADLAAVAIASILSSEEAHNAQVLRDTEKLQTALLNSVSHDLRTPLVSIIGVLSSLQEKEIQLTDSNKRNLLQVAREEAGRLNHLITNLLDVSRIEAHALRLHRQPSELRELVNLATEQLSNLTDRMLTINIPSDLPEVLVDFSLVAQVFFNILDNAVKYSPSGSPIEVTAQPLNQQVEVTVADRGVGIPAQDLLRVFDKFYRVQRPGQVEGTGLGLSICKGVVEAHGGHIIAENRQGGGTIIRLTLPTAVTTEGKVKND